MGWFSRLVDRLEERADRPADQSVLDNPRGGSERMIQSDTPQQAGQDVRRQRRSSRQRWLGR
jgi:hypothetical protein